MRSENRISVIGFVENIAWGTHFCQFCRTNKTRWIVPDFDINLELMHIIDRKYARDKIRRHIEKQCVANEELVNLSCVTVGSEVDNS